MLFALGHEVGGLYCLTWWLHPISVSAQRTLTQHGRGGGETGPLVRMEMCQAKHMCIKRELGYRYAKFQSYDSVCTI